MWYNEMTLMLRHYIDDLGDSPTYSDDRLKECLLVSAIRVRNDINVPSYIVDLDSLDITPDPTFGDDRNENFILLVGYCAAAMITASEFRTASGRNVLVQDGGSVVDMRYVAAQKKSSADFYQDTYDKLKLQYSLNNVSGRAIIGPTSIYGPFVGGYYSSYGFRSGY